MKDKPTEIDLNVVAQRNLNLTEQLFSDGVTIAYDEDGDTLFLTIGQPRQAINEPIVDGIFYRIDPTDLKVVGCTIIDFTSDILANNKLLRNLFQDSFDKLRQQGNTVTWIGSKAQRVKPLFELAT